MILPILQLWKLGRGAAASGPEPPLLSLPQLGIDFGCCYSQLSVPSCKPQPLAEANEAN